MTQETKTEFATNVVTVVDAEIDMVVRNYELALDRLERKVEEAQARLLNEIDLVDRPGRARLRISDHDAHNMGNMVHELAVLAGKFDELGRLRLFMTKEAK